MSMQAPVPLELTLHAASGRLEMLWSDGARACLSGRQLRAACRCAGCESLRRADRPVDAPESAAISELQPVGDVGLQIVFNDGHDRGIYPWPYLHQLCQP
jgi:DUF971 family protein